MASDSHVQAENTPLLSACAERSGRRRQSDMEKKQKNGERSLTVFD